MLKKIVLLALVLFVNFIPEVKAAETTLKISWQEYIVVQDSAMDGYYHYTNKKKKFAFAFPNTYKLTALYRSSFEDWRREGLTLESPDEADKIIIDVSYLKRDKASKLKKSYEMFLKDKAYEVKSSTLYDTFYEINYINVRTQEHCYTKRYVAEDATLSFITVTYPETRAEDAQKVINVVKDTFYPGW